MKIRWRISGVRSQYKTVVRSDQNICFWISISISSLTNWASWAPYTASCSSKLGIVIRFIGATLALPITNATETDSSMCSIRKKLTVDNANSDASVNVCSSTNEIGISFNNLRGRCTSWKNKSSFFRFSKSEFSSSCNGLSYFGPWFHAAWRILRNLIVRDQIWKQQSERVYADCFYVQFDLMEQFLLYNKCICFWKLG